MLTTVCPSLNMVMGGYAYTFGITLNHRVPMEEDMLLLAAPQVCNGHWLNSDAICVMDKMFRADELSGSLT